MARGNESMEQPTQIGSIMQLEVIQKIPKLQVSDEKCLTHGCSLVTFGNSRINFCEECAAEEEELEKEQRQQKIIEQKRKHWQSRYSSLAVGRRFKNATFENYIPQNADANTAKRWCQKYAETFADRKKSGDSLVLHGKPGTGKNHLAAALCKRIIDDGFMPLHTTAIRLIRRIKETWGHDADLTEQEAINIFVAPDLLVIDEVGSQFGSHAEQIILMEIINSRYADLMPTILISNLSVSDLEEILGTQIIDRFYEGKGGVIFFSWGSYRRAKL